ncbi:alpha-galactosidase [Ruania alba]|uniref:alpha-galactosidase n=1 Tax=Ruania alba TaxID=648782 RepID=A0A1H5BF26_9MICO|nr:alpha-galactosidase [Ruania alba]SED52550.1 alpha-galactosidase [Ruania alba]
MLKSDDVVYTLRAAGTALVIEVTQPVPRVLHWGSDLGLDGRSGTDLVATATPAVLNNSPDEPRSMTVWPSERDGWAGTPAQRGHAAGSVDIARPELVDSSCTQAPGGGGQVHLSFTDAVSGLSSTLTYTMDAAGVLAVDATVVRTARPAPAPDGVPYTLDGLRTLMPVPDRASERLDFTGKWCRERSPQRATVGFGSHVRHARRGKPGHDTPYLMAVGTPGFGFGHGEVWATHLAWSGDAEYLLERLPEGAGVFAAALGAGEVLRSGEVLLDDGDRYHAPTTVFVWSETGLDGIADRLHRRLRARASHPAQPRPLVLNTWEAVYFDHDMDRLTTLVERAAQVGVERVVLDDGWFHGRRGDDAGLGDWTVDAGVWPSGLDPFVDLVRSYGMQFGLWFEPEMINLDSDLARAHPDWVLGPRQGLGPSARNQYVLDIGRPDAYEHVLKSVSALVAQYRIDYLKWDHNRDLLEAVGRRNGRDRPAVHEQTLALYRMLDDLRERHPGLEIETCSGGGGRIDLGILDRTDRLWASDCNDPVERSRIEQWTRLLVPPELIGSHLGAERSHTTGRKTDLSYRLISSLTAHAGIEWDLTTASEAELAAITAWADLYRELRPLLHTGRVVNADLADEAVALTGVIAQDGSRAVFVWSRATSSPSGQSGRVRLPGLDPRSRYRLRLRDELGGTRRHQVQDPAWLTEAAANGLDLDGTVLTVVGIPLPTLNPQQALLLDVEQLG